MKPLRFGDTVRLTSDYTASEYAYEKQRHIQYTRTYPAGSLGTVVRDWRTGILYVLLMDMPLHSVMVNPLVLDYEIVDKEQTQ